MAGPYAGTMLADMGADVVKIEAPGSGDYSRGLGPFAPPLARDSYRSLRIASAVETSSLPGSSTWRVLTTPSSTTAA